MAVAAALSAVDPLWLALSRNRRRRFDDCLAGCDALLLKNNRDSAALLLKTKALTSQAYFDDTELEEEGVAELLLDDNATASMPRPGTSVNRPSLSRQGGGPDQSVRPVSSTGRPLTGFIAPGSSRPLSQQMTVETAFKGSRPGSSRPATTLGREVRLATASLESNSKARSIDTNRLNLARLAMRPPLAIAIAEYMVYHEVNPRKALDLAAECTHRAGFKDWWWKAMVGKCYYKLGLYREAERQYKSSLKEQDMVATHLELCKVYIRLDIPQTALKHLTSASETHPKEPRLLLGIARIQDMLANSEAAAVHYKRVLRLDASHVESIACLASNHFYNDQPELSLRYFRRLLQMGVKNTEIWNNTGLCCFYSAQYDMALSCFERALELADDGNVADVWFNLGHVAIGIGDANLAYQAFKIATSVDGNHAESFSNLAVLALRKNDVDSARANFKASQRLGPHLFEPFYNGALMAFKLGKFSEAFTLVNQALAIYPNHTDSLELLANLKRTFAVL